jgi:hypothetical protein
MEKLWISVGMKWLQMGDTAQEEARNGLLWNFSECECKIKAFWKRHERRLYIFWHISKFVKKP